MNIYAIYIITSDGRLMLDQIFQNNEKLPSEYILSGLLTSFKTIANELTGAYPESLIMGKIAYHFENFEDYFLVVVSDQKTKPSKILFTLGMKFSSKYGDIVTNWNGAMDLFYPFKQTIYKELSKISNFDLSGNIDPNKPLDSSELIFLKADLKPVALALIVLEEGSFIDIWGEVNRESEEHQSMLVVRNAIEQLKELGYVGQKEMEDGIIYFI